MGTKAEDMKAIIKEWLEEKPSRDIALLSRMTNVPYTTLRRIWNEGGEPNCNTTLALFSVIGSKSQCYTYLSNHFPEAARFHNREFAEEIKVTPYTESMRPFLEDFLSYFILNLGYAKIATKDGIRAVFGAQGLEKAHALVESGKLVWNGDKLISADGSDFFSYENKLDLLKACEHILTLSRGNRGYPVAVVGGLTDEDMDRAKFLTREYCQAIKDLVISSNAKGGKNLVAISMIFAMLENEVSA